MKSSNGIKEWERRKRHSDVSTCDKTLRSWCLKMGEGLGVERSVGQLLESANQPSGLKTQGTDKAWLWLHDTKVSRSAMYTSRTQNVATRRYRLRSDTHTRWVDGRKDKQESGKEKRGGKDKWFRSQKSNCPSLELTI